ncbi:MAG: hypothetical protein ABWY16_21480 [Pedobacter sp.]|uniref:hypothetical protein n=1 Tax=Pedobacter sp. TaxID=1411316 RepID=UPI0033931DAE
MRKTITALFVLPVFLSANVPDHLMMSLTRPTTVDSLGACQGVSYQKGRVFLYGDREIGVIREYTLVGDSLVDLHKESRLTVEGKDVINHPTGVAQHAGKPTFIGNSVKPDVPGGKWKAIIYWVNWEGLLKTRTLDGNLMSIIEDDVCIQGTRPEYVQYNNKWYVATADYGNNGNEVRLYDPRALSKASKTSDKGVLYKKFSCTPWVQNLHWIAEKGILVLIQNQVEGRKWRFTYVDLEKSIASGKQEVIKEVLNDRADELEGFAFTNSPGSGIAVNSSRTQNVNFMQVKWK